MVVLEAEDNEMQIVRGRRGETYSMPPPDTQLTALKRRATAPQQRSQEIRKSSYLLPSGERPSTASNSAASQSSS